MRNSGNRRKDNIEQGNGELMREHEQEVKDDGEKRD